LSDRSDFAIFGAGILGISSAYKLQIQHPEITIVVFEKDAILADQ
jgi:protoporphyrinogen oxidase